MASQSPWRSTSNGTLAAGTRVYLAVGVKVLPGNTRVSKLLLSIDNVVIRAVP